MNFKNQGNRKKYFATAKFARNPKFAPPQNPHP
jgi:hypothetical protein